MQLIIEQGNIGRKISGEFKIYGTREVLLSMIEQVKAQLGTDFISGWVKVEDILPNKKTTLEWTMD